MTGWIKLHRKLMDHWIWDNPEKLKWWIEIIFLANHTDKKILNNNQLEVIERGTFHTSELRLSKQWNVSRNTVRKFLMLLENDGMISIKKTNSGTTIEVHNYRLYQENPEIKKHQIEHQYEQRSEHQNIENSQKYNKEIGQKSEQQTEQQNEQVERRRDNDLSESPSENLNNRLNSELDNTLNTSVNNELNSGVNTTKNYKNYKNYKNVKKKDTREGARVNAFDFYQQNGFGILNQYVSQEISQYLDEFPEDSDEIVIKALKIAIDRNKVSWGYAKPILKDWAQKGLQTIRDIDAYELQQTTKFQNKSRPMFNNQSLEKTPEWLLKQKQGDQERKQETSDDFKQRRKAIEEEVAEFDKQFRS